jgi:AcrR family transcriptional regulator
VGTVYTVFDGKEELFGEVLSRRLPELLQTTAEAAYGARTTFERLTVGLRSYVTYMLEHPDYLRIHLREHAWGLGPTYATPEQKEAWYEGLELETTFLKMGMEEGIVIEEDPFLLARCVTAVHQVQLWNWVEKGMTEPIAQVADRMDRLFLQMFCTAKGRAQQLN